ncbi:methionine adenosyltransferase [Candidatus Roizmanbacteria bacterium]|nr:methionine adenosyltransferase [Candidatus Roizmanbacteria bacterium]
MNNTFTSESVCAGHPDKICDQVSDAILDEAYRQDKYSRVAVETMVTKNFIAMAGEVTTKAKLNYKKIAQKVIRDLGYNILKLNFSDKSEVVVKIHTQSPEIAVGVDNLGAGDQGCIKIGSLVRTKKGFEKIENIRQDDFVLTPNGYRKVLKAKKTGIKEIIKLNFINGMILECTKDHQILCYNRDGNTYWKEANGLTKNDFVCMLKPQDNFEDRNAIKSHVDRKSFFTKYNHKIYGSEDLILNEEISYMMGVMIGDGCVNKSNYIEIAFGNEYEYALLVKNIVSKYFGDHFRLIKYKNNNYSLKIDSVLVRKHFKNFGILYSKSFEKTTPKSIFTSQRNIIASYISGLFDTDGTIVENTGRNKKNIRIRLSSSSYTLLQETQLLLNQFGIKSVILFNRPKGTLVGRDHRYKSEYDNYVLSLSGYQSYITFCKEIGFHHPNKNKRAIRYLNNTKQKPRHSRSIYLIPHPYKNEFVSEKYFEKDYPFSIVQIKKKMTIGKEEVYDLEIDNEHIFSANGIYVHNCMFGYACRETKELMPLPIMLAHRLAMGIDKLREARRLPYLRPDGKTQVTVGYEKGVPKTIENVVLAVPHNEKIKLEQVKKDLYKLLIVPQLTNYGFKINIKQLIVNGTGVWHIGGPSSDTGVTGRKIVVDTYGGMARVGGGAFSGKDPTKVDRSAAYAARYLAKNIVANKLADRCEIRLAYFIGAKKPVMQETETFGTEKKSVKIIKSFIDKLLDTSLKGIIEGLNLRRSIYFKTASYGHFGRDIFPWERVRKI